MVRLVSAMDVASTILRMPGGAGEIASSCASSGISPNSGKIRIDCGQVRLFQEALHAADFALARQEDQHAAAFLGDGLADGRRDGRFHVARGDVARRKAGVDGKGAAAAGNDRGVAQQAGRRRGVECRRHQQQAQLRAQGGLRVQAQGEGEIAVEPALVKLVEQHGADPVQGLVVLQAAQEQAVGHDLDAGARADPAVHAHAIADGFAHPLAQAGRHVARGRAGGEAPGLKDDDALSSQPPLLQQGQGHAGGLARPGGGLQHRVRTRGQCRQELRQDLVDGQGGGGAGRHNGFLVLSPRRR